MTHTAVSAGRHHPLLGTNVDVRIAATARTRHEAQVRADRAHDAAVAEVQRLQGVFTVFDPGSELSRWRRADLDRPGPELAEVLAAAERYWRLSGGAFHPAAGAMRERWTRAERENEPPTEDELSDLAARHGALPYRVVDGAVERVGDCGGLDLNAIAKGYIVDAAVTLAATADGVTAATVNAGGDLRRIGGQPATIRVDDPRHPGRTVATFELGDGAVATSSPTFRGFTVGGRWYGHVIDPRTAQPVQGRPSTTVRADDAVTADATATVLGVLPVELGMSALAQLPGLAVLAIEPDGSITRAGDWSPALGRGQQQ